MLTRITSLFSQPRFWFITSYAICCLIIVFGLTRFYPTLSPTGEITDSTYSNQNILFLALTGGWWLISVIQLAFTKLENIYKQFIISGYLLYLFIEVAIRSIALYFEQTESQLYNPRLVFSFNLMNEVIFGLVYTIYAMLMFRTDHKDKWIHLCLALALVATFGNEFISYLLYPVK